MDLLKQARKHWQQFSMQEFGVDFTIENRKGIKVQSRGLTSVHHLGIDANGVPVNTKNIHLQINEQDLIDKCYPTRNDEGEIDLVYHLVEFKDNLDINHKYIINEIYPDKNVGAIMCILGDYE